MRELFFWTAVVSCVAAQALILRSTWRARARAIHGGARTDVPQPRTGAEFTWVILPAVMLAVVLTFTWRAIRETSPSPSALPAPHQHDAPPLPL